LAAEAITNKTTISRQQGLRRSELQWGGLVQP